MPHRAPSTDCMQDLRELMMEAREFDRMDEVFMGMSVSLEAGAGDPGRPPAGKSLYYGCVVVDPGGQHVFLRHTSNPGRRVFGWTFSKGAMAESEYDPRATYLFKEELVREILARNKANRLSPEQLVVRNAARQLRWRVRLNAPLPTWFVGDSVALWYWLAEAMEAIKPEDLDFMGRNRGEIVQCFSWDEAASAIQANPSRGADLLILEAARRLC